MSRGDDSMFAAREAFDAQEFHRLNMSDGNK